MLQTRICDLTLDHRASIFGRSIGEALVFVVQFFVKGIWADPVVIPLSVSKGHIRTSSFIHRRRESCEPYPNFEKDINASSYLSPMLTPKLFNFSACLYPYPFFMLHTPYLEFWGSREPWRNLNASRITRFCLVDCMTSIHNTAITLYFL